MDAVMQRSGFFFLRGLWGQMHELISVTHVAGPQGRCVQCFRVSGGTYGWGSTG